MEAQLKERLMMGSLSVFLVTLMITFSHIPHFFPFFILAVGTIISLTLLEYYNLAEKKGFEPLYKLGIGSTILYIAAMTFSMYHPTYSYLPDLILYLSLGVFFLVSFRKPNNSVINLAITAFGIVYLTIPLTTIININYFKSSDLIEHGRLWLTYIIVVTKSTDLGGYFSGKFLGKHLITPSLSPKKTIEGAIGGTLLATLASFLFYYFLFGPLSIMSLEQSVILGIVIAVLAQFGDLAESLLKRDANVKDSSHIPGLGGMLDIMDSLVFTLPLMYLLLKMHVLG